MKDFQSPSLRTEDNLYVKKEMNNVNDFIGNQDKSNLNLEYNPY